MTEQEKYFFNGEAHRLQGKLEQAISYYEKALQIDPEHDDTLFRTGCCYLKLGQLEGDCFNENTFRFEKAASVFHRIIVVQERRGSVSRDSYDIYHNLGEAQYHLAVTIMQRKTSRDFSGVPAWQGLIEKAIENYKQAIALNPNYAESYHWLGNAQFVVGLYEEAIKNYKRAIALNPDKISYYYPLSSVQEELGLNLEATKSYDQAMELLIRKIN